MALTKKRAEQLAQEFETTIVDFYGWHDSLETTADEDDVVIKSKHKGVFYEMDLVALFLAGRPSLSWYAKVDEEGFICVRIY